MGNTEHDFAMERRLQKLDPILHRNFTNAVFAIQYNLSNYKLIFPAFTDHTMLHSLSVIDFTNQLIGDQIDKLNADEIYTLLMGCYFHDTGMGITLKDFERFCSNIEFGNYFETHDRNDYPRIIRDFHHEFSGQFIRRYAGLFEYPSEEHMQALIQISRGHRRTDLFDETAYPSAMKVPGGNTVCLPYLAALIRLADEIDVAAARNPILLYDIEAVTEELSILENKKLKAVRYLDITPEQFILRLDTSELTQIGPISVSKLISELKKVVEKMQWTLDYCREVVEKRTPFRITQKEVVMDPDLS